MEKGSESMSSEPLHVLVIGGGIGGLCLAQGLKKAGVSVAVYERDRSRGGRLGGFRLHINPDGSGALHECLPPAVWEAFVSTTGEPGDLGFLTEKLEWLTAIEEGGANPTSDDSAEGSHAADRVTLRRVLLTGLDDAVHFDKEFERYEETPEGKVEAFFRDGTSATGDLVVGADGAGSRVRGQYLPEAGQVETGAIGVGLKLPLTDQTRSWLPPRISGGMNMVIAPAPFFLFTSAFERRTAPADVLREVGVREAPRESGRGYRDYVLCAFVARHDALPSDVHDLDGPDLMRVIDAMIEDWHPDLRRLVAGRDPDSVWVGSHVASVPIAPWESTNVTLLGDAIHTMPPVGGLGGNTALRDARLLCRTLGAVHRGEAPLVPAIHDYEAEMRDSGFAAVRTALRYQRQGLRSNRIATAGARTRSGSWMVYRPSRARTDPGPRKQASLRRRTKRTSGDALAPRHRARSRPPGGRPRRPRGWCRRRSVANARGGRCLSRRRSARRRCHRRYRRPGRRPGRRRPRRTEGRLGVASELVGAGHVHGVVQGAGGAREVVLRPPGVAPAGGGQDQAGTRERGLPDDLWETEVPADDERDARAPGFDGRQARTRDEKQVLPGRPDEVTLAVGEEDVWVTADRAGADQVRAVGDAARDTPEPLREPVGDVDVQPPGEVAEEAGARPFDGVLGVLTRGRQAGVGRGEELRQDHPPQGWVRMLGLRYGSLRQETVPLDVAGPGAQVQGRDGRHRPDPLCGVCGVGSEPAADNSYQARPRSPSSPASSTNPRSRTKPYGTARLKHNLSDNRAASAL